MHSMRQQGDYEATPDWSDYIGGRVVAPEMDQHVKRVNVLMEAGQTIEQGEKGIGTVGGFSAPAVMSTAAWCDHALRRRRREHLPGSFKRCAAKCEGCTTAKEPR